jgi:excisionase family DNA binding protein
MTLDTTKLLTVPQAATALALKPKTIRSWIAARRIGCVRLGSAVRVPVSEVARLIEGGTIPARQQ